VIDFVPYQEALELQKIGAIFLNVGFPHFAIYRNGNLSFANQDAIKMFVEDFKDEVVTAPLYQQAFRWFRGNHDLQASTIMFSNGKYDSGITRHKGTQVVWGKGPVYNTYEEAELDCLRKLIEIVKSKQ